jgi:hypothetical protein
VVEPTTEQMTDLSRVIVTNPSMHGITYTQPDNAPDDWAETLLGEHIEEHLQLGDGLTDATEWRNQIAVSLVPATRIEAIDTHPENRPYSRIAVATSLFGPQLVSAHPDGDWYDPETGTPVTFDIDAPDPPGLTLSYQVPRSIDDQIRRNTSATPSNALTHEGEPVGRNTYGLLTPAPTIVTAVQIIGRESRRTRNPQPTRYQGPSHPHRPRSGGCPNQKTLLVAGSSPTHRREDRVVSKDSQSNPGREKARPKNRRKVMGVRLPAAPIRP